MTEDPLKPILTDLAEDARPAVQVDLWPRLQTALAESNGRSPQGKSMMKHTTLYRRLAFTALIVLAAVALLLATPQGRAFSLAFRNYFHAVPETQLTPVPTPVAASTYALEAGLAPMPVQPASVPGCGEAINPIDSTFACQLQDAQARLGFAVRSFPAQYVQLPFAFMQMDVDKRTLHLSFRDPQSFRSYILEQGVGDLPDDSVFKNALHNPVFQDAVENVEVGGNPAEFVAGEYIFPHGQVNENMAWSADEPVFRLRWREGDHWYEFTLVDSQYVGANLPAGRAHMIQVAENLTGLDQGAEGLTAGNQPSLRDSAGFTIKTPGLLPQGFQQVADGTWSNLTTQPRVGMDFTYTVDGVIENSLTMYEMLIPPDEKTLRREYGLLYQGLSVSETLTATLGDPVQIGDLTGYALDGGASNTRALYWRDDTREYLLIYQWAPSFGGRLDEQTLIAIAASMK